MAAARGDAFPKIRWQGFSNFCADAQILDKRGARLANLDRTFNQMDQNAYTGKINKNLALNRAQFLETLVRISDLKYK